MSGSSRRSVPRRGAECARGICLATTLALFTAGAVVAQDVRETTVGASGRISGVLIPGPRLVVRPIDSDAALVVRILDTFPHGERGFRYDIEYSGLEPGQYNILDGLQTEDGGRATGDPIAVSVKAVLPAGQVRPNQLSHGNLPRVGGYQLIKILAIAGWIIGLLLILFWGRGGDGRGAGGTARQTLAQRLRPLLEDAMAGRLPAEKHSDLELTLVAWWRKRLDMERLPADESLMKLRAHEVAGPLLRQLESWLHQPPDRREQTDLAALLKPYESLSAAGFDHSDAGGVST